MIWDEKKVPFSREQLLDQDLIQQRALYKLSRRKADDPESYELRERRWLRITYFGSAGLHERAPEEFDS